MRHYQRGQVLPLWAGAIITTLMFAFLAINYGNTIRYQIRAQNAADSVAQGLMAVQAERFNKMEVALYATAVEEYRLRHVLDGLLLATNDSGGCQDSYATATLQSSGFAGGPFAEGTCAEVYHDLALEYAASLNRYTTDAKLLNDYSSYSTYTNWINDTSSLMTHLTSTADCNSASPTAIHADGTDCYFKYHILGQQKRTGLLCVQQDAQNILVPGLGRTCPSTGVDTENAELFAPAQVDVVSCAQIPPVVPNFGPLHLATQYAIGRAAATTVQFEEDWLQPGSVDDPVRAANTFFQPMESYTNWTAGSDSSEAYNWYGVDFGGNAGVAYVNYGVFNQPTYDNEFSVRMGWWNSIAIKPFAAADTMAQACSS